MKINLLIIFITASMLIGGNVPSQNKKEIIDVALTVAKKETSADSLLFFTEAVKTDLLTDRLIAKNKKLSVDNKILLAEIKRLKKNNLSLRTIIDTVYIHDTVFKRRRFYQIFKK